MRKTILFTLFIIALGAECASGEVWQDVTLGLTDKEFYSIAESQSADNKVIYIGASDGLYKKEKDDDGWSCIFASYGQYKGVTHILVDANDVVYIATQDGLYQSNNFGKSWKQLFSGIGEENRTTYVLSDTKNKKIIYLGTNKGLFWTENKGETWEKARGILGKSKINSITLGKLTDVPCLFIIANNEVYKATQNLKSYEKIFGYDSIENFEDNNEGEEEPLENGPIFLLNSIFIKKDILYLCTNRGIFTFEDGGRLWFQFNDTGLSNRWINDLLISDDSSVIFAATRKGVFEYNEKKRLWDGIYYGMVSTDVRKLMVTNNSELWALCKARVYRTTLGHLYISDKISTKVDDILSNFKNEPTINETINMAVEYAEVYPEKIKEWRKGAKLKALLPKVSFGIDQSKSDTYEIYTSSTKTYWTYGPEDGTEGWDLNLTWDLSDLIWNEVQTSIDVRSKLMVQLRDDIVNEVMRTYFERRRLQIGLLMELPTALPTLLDKRLRIQELTASLDGLTGSRFSEAIERK